MTLKNEALQGLSHLCYARFLLASRNSSLILQILRWRCWLISRSHFHISLLTGISSLRCSKGNKAVTNLCRALIPFLCSIHFPDLPTMPASKCVFTTTRLDMKTQTRVMGQMLRRCSWRRHVMRMRYTPFMPCVIWNYPACCATYDIQLVLPICKDSLGPIWWFLKTLCKRMFV